MRRRVVAQRQMSQARHDRSAMLLMALTHHHLLMPLLAATIRSWRVTPQ
jgi:hypothetical protein